MTKKNKTKKLLSKNRARNGERVRLKGLVQRQADKLKTKNRQLRNGAAKQIRSEELIQIDATLIRKKGG